MPPPPAGQTGDLARIEAKLDQVLDAINAPPEGADDPGGLKSRMAASESDRRTMHATLTLLVSRVEALEAGPGTRALSWWDRVGVGLLGLLLAAASALAGAALRGGGGTHP